jgi:hypothetical protein
LLTAFEAPHLTSPEQLGRLEVEPGRNQLPLPLRSDLGNIPVFRKAIRTLHGWGVSPNLQLPYSTVAPWMKKLGAITGFRQIARPYTLRYAAGKAFDDNGKRVV